MNYYEILGVNKNATEEEIRRAYRKIAKENHPDYFPDDKEKEEKLKKANEAYQTLLNPDKRKNYDLSLNFNKESSDKDFGGEETSDKINVDIEDIIYKYLRNTTLETAYDAFIRFLDEKDEEFGLTSEKLRKNLQGKRGILTQKEIKEYMKNINKQIVLLQENKKAFDRFKSSLENLKKLIENPSENIDFSKYEDYIARTKITSIDRKELDSLDMELFQLSIKLKNNLNNEYKQTLNELNKRGIKFFLKNFGVEQPKENIIKITYEILTRIKEYITLYDKVMYNLSVLKIDLKKLLLKLNITFDNLTIEKLRIINSNLEEMIENNLRNKNEIIEEIKNKL